MKLAAPFLNNNANPISQTKPWCFVDIETTGARAQQDRIIEIGVIRVENGKVVKTWEQLINPNQWFPDFISNLTQITPTMLSNKPRFADVADELLELLDGSVFVAHNARFDYSFMKAEFRRLNIDVSWPQLCSVRLSRTLFPGYKSHSLDSLIARHDLKCSNRHRALGDAEVIWQFFSQVIAQQGWDTIHATSQKLTKDYALPPQLNRDMIADLPDCPGVYIFYGEHGEPLYIGKSKAIRSRVQAHFYSDVRSDKELLIKELVFSIETRSTAGELGALLLESQLIKAMQPIFNRTLRRCQDPHQVILSLNSSRYYQIQKPEPQNSFNSARSDVRCYFKTKQHARRTLAKLADQHKLCYKLLGLESGSGACLRFHLGQCPGACIGKEMPARYNVRVMQAFSRLALKSWTYSGPIVIKEYNTVTDQQASHVFDQWCYLGEAFYETIPDELIRGTKDFDLDTYAILKRFLFKTPNSVCVLSEIKAKSQVQDSEFSFA